MRRQSSPLAHQPVGDLVGMISAWREGEGLGKHMTAIRRVPGKAAEYGAWPQALAPQARQALERRGMHNLYIHQAEAITHALSGEHVVVVTPTASGKSLCYHLPVIDALTWGGNSLYLFPTKALSQDQCAELNALLQDVPGRDASWQAHVYDGDTPPELRKRVKRQGRLVVTNPDMLHAGILPHHNGWAPFLSRLEYVILDELHTYRGVFGGHVANVMRRLQRLCAHYGSNPTFIATSATIANPQELAETVVGRSFHLVTRNGAPSSARTLCFVNPPLKDVEQQRRQSALGVAERITRDAMTRGLGTIVFARSRQSVELLIHRLKHKLGRDGLGERVASYRGGYLPELRRRIERGLREGTLLGVVSTNALELGVDIGSLDVCVLAGYPGTIASTWQQIGRAGRRGSESLSVLIATDDPLDQFMIQHPDYFFAQPPEHARLDPDNLRVAVEHLRCACYELPWPVGEAYGAFDAQATEEMFAFLAAQGQVQRVGEVWRCVTQGYPAGEVNLRSIAEEGFVVVDVSGVKERVIAQVDFESAHTALYPNAIYQVEGVPYQVERLDYAQRRALVRPSEDGHFTTAMRHAAVSVLDTFEERFLVEASVGHGEVCVSQRFTGYKKVRFGTGENVGFGELNLPQLDLHTMSYWLTLASSRFERIGEQPDHWARVVQGLGQVLQVAASLQLMCDPRDIDLCVGSVQQDQWLTRDGQDLVVRDRDGRAMPTRDSGDAAMTVGPPLYNPTIFIYDRFPGGVGFGEGLFEGQARLMTLARELVEGCACQQGCPSCVGPPAPDTRPVRPDVIAVLRRLALAQPASR